MKTIYLVRHGEALDDVENRYGGWSDDSLTEKGKRTARELAKKVANLSPKPKKIYSSPFRRAAKTAEIIGAGLKLPIVKVNNLKERNRYGVLTSITKTEAKARHPGMVKRVEDYMQTIEGAETYEHFRDRVLQALKKILQETQEDALVVCHGGTFRIVMWELLKKSDYKRANLHAIITLKQSDNKLTLKSSEGLVFKS